MHVPAATASAVVAGMGAVTSWGHQGRRDIVAVSLGCYRLPGTLVPVRPLRECSKRRACSSHGL
ncbi:hypothetical protein Taro_048461 [Colocasia esculenta]|uniref:Uncharacterized protein n=1 Tax=Colocasia esculenta TaxID=4460 RepID=A0A843X2S7_COLES|nr:hypothetical protein [Colocasia esculenta]